MNEQLIKLIDLCLADGVISDKEREVIFRKAKSLGVDEDECEIILEGMIQKVKNAPIVTNLTPAKPKRNFPLKEVKSIKPAPLDKEKELYKEVDALIEKEKKLTSDFNLVSKDLKAINKEIESIDKEIKSIKSNVKVDFEKYKESYTKYCIKNITEYFNYVNNLISEKYGKTHIVCSEKKMEELSYTDLKTVNQFIIYESEWSTETYQKNAGCWTTIMGFAFTGAIILFLLGAFFDDGDLGEYIIYWIFIIILVIIGSLASNIANFWKGNTEDYKLRNKMIFTEDDVRAVLKSIDKKFEKSFKEVEDKKDIIKKYERLLNYDLSIPEYKKSGAH